jgi:hypothetical protein
MKRPAAIDVAIDTLVLDGVDVRDPTRFEAALTRELGRLLGAHGPPAAWSAGTATTAPEAPPPITPASSAEAWGEAVAASVHAQLAPTAPVRR